MRRHEIETIPYNSMEDSLWDLLTQDIGAEFPKAEGAEVKWDGFNVAALCIKDSENNWRRVRIVQKTNATQPKRQIIKMMSVAESVEPAQR